MPSLLDDFTSEFGTFFSNRTQVPLSEEVRERIGKGAKEIGKLVGKKPSKELRTDGLKVYFGKSKWVLVRPSGTEPVARIYAEANTEEEVKELLDAGKALLSED